MRRSRSRIFPAPPSAAAIWKSSGLPPELKPAVAVLRGRLAEALGHDRDALDQYRIAVEFSDRPAAAEARLLEIALRQKRDEIGQADALRQLETVSVMWRGDGLEVKALEVMARIYSDTGRYGEVAGGGTNRDQAAAQFRNIAARPGRGGGAVRAALSQPEGRRSSAGRCARVVL